MNGPGLARLQLRPGEKGGPWRSRSDSTANRNRGPWWRNRYIPTPLGGFTDHGGGDEQQKFDACDWCKYTEVCK